MALSTFTNPYASHVWKFYSRRVRLEQIKLRRQQNATARRLGFRNYNAWQGDES